MSHKNPIANLYRTMWQYSKGNRIQVVLFWLMEIVSNALLLGNALIISRAFNTVQFSSDDPGLLIHLIGNLTIMLGIIVVFWLLHGNSRVMEMKNAFLVRKNYKEDALRKTLLLPLEWHRKHHSGETIDKINKAADGLYAFSEGTFMINSSVVKTLGSLIAIYIFDPWAALIAVVVTSIAFLSMLRFDATMRKRFLSIYRFENRLASAIHDYITNVFSIIALRMGNRVNREIAERSTAAFPDFSKNVATNEIKWFSIGFFTTFMTVAILSLNAYLSFTTTGVIVIGTLFALYSYLQNIGSVFSQFALQYGKFVQSNTAIEAAIPIHVAYEMIPAIRTESLPENWNSLEIRDLHFTHATDEETQGKGLHDVTITIGKNQKIAFIGESGSGKTTALTLLRGLYAPKSCDVYCDGKKLKNGLEHLHDHVTLIPQEPELFNSTVRDNITMDTSAQEKDLAQAITLAQFESILDRLPKGLETYVLEKGVSLSGGEKQRLALARGLLASRNSDFVFMDEPTSSVDFGNEMNIYRNVLKAFDKKTVISTVHNLALLKYFDLIYVFKDGRVTAQGSLGQLMDNSAFKPLWEHYNETLR